MDTFFFRIMGLILDVFKLLGVCLNCGGWLGLSHNNITIMSCCEIMNVVGAISGRWFCVIIQKLPEVHFSYRYLFAPGW